MNKSRQSMLVIMLALLVIALGIWLLLGTSRQRALISQHYTAIELPAILSHADKMAGCNGSGGNACATYAYSSAVSWAQGSTALQSKLRDDGLMIYTATGGTSFIATSTDQDLELWVSSNDGNGKYGVDIIVKELTP